MQAHARTAVADATELVTTATRTGPTFEERMRREIP